MLASSVPDEMSLPLNQHGKHSTDDKPPFRFLDLPTEIHHLIFKHLLPHKSTIRIASLTESLPIRIRCTPRNAYVPTVSLPTAPHIISGRQYRVIPILHVNKRIYNEALDVLYSQNRFVFYISRPTLSVSSAIISTFEHMSLSVLARLRQVEVVVEEELHHKEVYKCVQGKLKEMVTRLGMDHNLRSLKICLRPGTWDVLQFWSHHFSDYHRVSTREFRLAPTYTGWQYCLEPLAGLRGIPTVEITGQVERDLAMKLARIIEAPKTVEELPMVKYKTTKVSKRKRGKAGKVEVHVKRRKFAEPMIDWEGVNS